MTKLSGAIYSEKSAINDKLQRKYPPMRFELERSPTERLIIEATEYKGHDLVTLRIYFLSKEDEWLPTKKGVTFKREQLDEVLGYLNQIKAGK